MDHSPSSRHSHNAAEVNKIRIEREAKEWAEGVNEENAWDSVLLALGTMDLTLSWDVF